MADTKRCSRCKKEKPLSEFGKDTHAKDGLFCYCKPCLRAYNEEYKKTVSLSKINSKSKRCSRCGLVKPAEQFIKNMSSPDGLASKCKECNREWHRLYKKVSKERAEGKSVENITAKGIDSIEQVDSVLREMSELQFKINTERKLLSDRIKMLTEYTENIIESDLWHQYNLHNMLKEFLKRISKNGSMKKENFRFGLIKFSKGKLEYELRPVLAGELMGKP